MANPNVDLTLDEAVAEVLGLLTGLDLSYDPEYDRYRAIARQLNRALRNNALDHEWSYYSSTEDIGTAHTGDQEIALRASIRPRIIGDDSVRFVDSNGNALLWAYILPRDALSKYIGQPGLYAAVTKSTLRFSRPLSSSLDGLTIQVPVMREPRMFDLPPAPETEGEVITPISAAVREQTVDFDFPDVIIMRAAYQYAQTDPVMQPRVQTLEAQYKDLGYGLVERDDRNTDSPFMNEFFVPISNSIFGPDRRSDRRPHADENR
jgi:hypothetical protein